MSLEALRDALVVSCQAPPGSPLRAPAHMAAMARAALAGGARGIRAEGRADIEAIARAVELPVIGLRKVTVPDSDVYITPTLESAFDVVAAGAGVLAVDATLRPRPGGERADDFIRRLNRELDVPVLADVDTLEAGMRAREAGAAAVATTMSGHVGPTPAPDGPDVELVAELAERLDCPVVAEGRYRTPGEVRAAFAAGAFAVVVGTAITNPVALTQRFAAATPIAAAAARGGGR
jgi:putative N-acetylmannosamine-6-phosphate epimerase